MEITWLFLIGVVCTVIPALLIIGFALYTLHSFTSEDDDAKAVFNVALGFFAVGVVCLIAHYVGISF